MSPHNLRTPRFSPQDDTLECTATYCPTMSSDAGGTGTGTLVLIQGIGKITGIGMVCGARTAWIRVGPTPATTSDGVHARDKRSLPTLSLSRQHINTNSLADPATIHVPNTDVNQARFLRSHKANHVRLEPRHKCQFTLVWRDADATDLTSRVLSVTTAA